jgi:chromosome segregation protein
MKIDFVELCGFRGFRDRLRIDFAPGFTVITGRNGVGKSTLCDAIEFAITGDIDKYRVEKAARENLADYLWWRGEGSSREHYVTVGFSDGEGHDLVISRTRESGPSLSVPEIERALCIPGGKPDKALEQVCRTSIVRDEWIASLSLDLTERERFDLVRAALGAVSGPDYAGRAADTLKAADAARAEAEADYEEAHARLNRALTELAETRDIARQAGDVAGALSTLAAQVPELPTDVTDAIAAARSWLTDRRMRLNGLARAVEEAREISAERAVVESSAFQAEKTTATQAVASLEAECQTVLGELSEARARLAAEEETDTLAASLAALVDHGGRLGLHDGRCPLCDAVRNAAQFEAGIAAARARLGELGRRLTEARRRVTELEAGMRAATTRLRAAQANLSQVSAREQRLAAREAAHLDIFSQYQLDFALTRDPRALEAELVVERGRIVDLERSILTLDASRAVDRVADLEARVESLRTVLDAAAERVAKWERAAASARNIDHAVKRTNAEIIEERLAVISPLLNELYQRLRPHAEWRSIEYSIRGDVRRFLSLKVGNNLNPQFVFSSGQRRAAGLAFLLSVHLARSWCRWNTLILDDPVQHIDDYRALHLVEVLTALRQGGRQIVCAVEDASLADLLTRRLRSMPDSPGRRFDLDIDKDGSAGIVRRTDVHSMPVGILRGASEASEAV